MLIFGELHLEYVIKEQIQHYHTNQPYQSLGDEISEPHFRKVRVRSLAGSDSVNS